MYFQDEIVHIFSIRMRSEAKLLTAIELEFFKVLLNFLVKIVIQELKYEILCIFKTK